MMNNVISNYFNLAHIRDLVTGALKITPLCIAVLPWGLLAGSMAIQAGLSPAQAIGMSAFVFAGAAQLVSLGMIMAGAPLISIVCISDHLTTLPIRAQLTFICEK